MRQVHQPNQSIRSLAVYTVGLHMRMPCDTSMHPTMPLPVPCAPLKTPPGVVLQLVRERTRWSLPACRSPVCEGVHGLLA